ncbi:LysE family translocator, partial [Acidiphilium sp.]|uniref:LysE family translocator n=1 Tax=Acidiphilium sp. TaxID=527 RepID=UPI003D074173
YGLLTVAGTSTAMALQLSVTALGLATLLGQFSVWFGWVRWIGVIYLVYLGVVSWRAPAHDPALPRSRPRSARAIWARGFLVSLTNPKTLFFYGALLPQFIDRASGFGHQMAVLALTCVGIALVIDSLWCLLACRLRGRLSSRLANRVGGGVLIGAGIGLALARGARP